MAPRTANPGVLRALDHLCVACIVVAYVAGLAWAFSTEHSLAWGLIVVPGLGFVVLSIVRARIDAPRPYEVAELDPPLDASTQGKSFPSRHVGSGALIGASLLYLEPLLGVGVLLLTAVLAYVRVAGQVHFSRDVIAGYGCGVVFALLGMLPFVA